MDFIRRNINKTNRNGTVYVGEVSKISTGNIDISNLQGDFLPATSTDKITYTVPHYVNFTETVDNVTKNILQITSEGIKINGNVIATGEVSAFGAGESGSGGGNVTVYDGLDSTSTDIALSANQGRILKGLIDNIDVGDIDLTGYYSKTEIDNKLSAKADSTHTHTSIGDYTTFKITKYDNSGWYTWYLMADITALQTLTQNGLTYGFTGFVNVHRDSGNLNEQSGMITFRAGWNNSIKVLKSTISYVIPYIVKYDSKYYLALRLSGSNKEISFWGYKQNLLSTFTELRNTASDTLPSGMEIITEPSIYYLSKSGVAYDGDGNNIVDTYATKTELSGKSDTSHTHSQYYDSEVSRTANTVLAAPNGSAGTATFRKLVAADIPTLAISKISGLQSALDGKSNTHSHPYLSLTGGTITSSVSNPLAINTTAGRLPYIAFQNNGTNGGFVGGLSSGSMYIQTGTANDEQYNIFKVNVDGSLETSVNGTYYDVITDLNASSKTVGNATKFNGYTMRTSNTWVNNSIDARVQYTINASALSSSNFYPIIFSSTPKDLYVCMYSQPSSASASYNQNKLEFTFRGQGWNDTPTSLTVHNYNCYTSGEMTIGSIGMGQEGGHKVIWVRGGLIYYIISNITPLLKTTDFTSGNEVYTVGTGLSGGTNTKVTVYWTPQTTSGLGTMYHSAGIALGGGFSVAGSAAIKGTLTSTGKITGSNGATITGTIDTNFLKAANLTYKAGTNAYLNSAGWYRIATSNVANNVGGTYIFSIRRDYYTHNNEAYIIAATLDFSGCYFTQLAGHYNTQLLTTFRCTYDNNGTAYFDIYYTGTAQNRVYINGIGNMTLQTPTKVTTGLAITKQTSLTEGHKQGSTGAYPITLFRNNSSGGVYIMYGAANQLTKTWAAGSDGQHRFGWYYKDTSQDIDVEQMWLDSSGNLTCTGEVTAYSDIRLKTNIKPLKVRGELNPVTYEKDGKQSIGFIANEVQEIYPELVNDSDEYLSLNYAQLTAVLYAELKELRKEINELKNKIQ